MLLQLEPHGQEEKRETIHVDDGVLAQKGKDDVKKEGKKEGKKGEAKKKEKIAPLIKGWRMDVDGNAA